jgi:hypothetical protein
MKNILYILLIWNLNLFGQEQVHKIKSDGEFEYSFKFLQKEIKGIYKGEYFKEKIDGDKQKIPHGKGMLITVLENKTLLRTGKKWSEGKLDSNITVETTNWNFEGEVKNGEPIKGKITYNHEANFLASINIESKNLLPKEYNGSFLNDLYEKGDLIFFNDFKYSGSFLNGLMHGYGKLVHINGRIYEGEFLNGKFNGKGRLIIDKTIIEGEFKEGEIFGKSVVKYQNGDIYEGTLKEMFPDGYGKYILKNGDKYEGDFKNGKYEGKGTYTTKDRIISGNFKESKTIGKSFVKFNNGNTYEGDLDNFILQGSGKFTYLNGDIEVGEWQKDIFVKGVAKYKIENSTWEGEFVDNYTSGKGKITYNNGSIYKGDWNNGSTSPKNLSDTELQYSNNDGYLTLPDNSKYEGYFFLKTGLPDGLGKLTLTDGNKKMGMFINGVLNEFKVSCTEKEIFTNDGYDPNIVNTCIFGKYKNISTGYADDAGRYAYGSEISKLVDNKYVLIKNEDIFNKKKSFLLEKLNDEIKIEFNSLINEYRDCFEDPNPPTAGWDDFQINFTDTGITFSINFGVSNACRAADGAIIEISFDELLEYINFN